MTGPRTPRMRLVIVEDNPNIAENLSEVFEDEFDIRVAGDGRTAVKIASAGFDVAILDIRLPDITGTTLLRAMKEGNPDAEIVVHTGNADLESAIEAVRGDAYAYLLKPVRIEELRRTVRNAAEKIELRRSSEKLQLALLASEQKLRDIFDTVGAAIVAVDETFRIRFANRGTTEILGFSAEELLGTDVIETLTTPGDQASCRHVLAAALEGKAETYEANCKHKDGSTRVVHWRWTRVRNGQQTDAAYGVGTDVTEQKELERRMRAQERLAAAGTLTAGLAHEIRNPLNAAVLQLSLLLRLVKRLPEGERETLTSPIDVVRAELKRLDALLEDFLRLARPRANRDSIVDLDTVIRDVVRLESEAAKSRRIKLEVEGVVGTRVRGEADALKQVLVNLIKNALEAARKQVRIVVGAAGTSVQFDVVDDGPGISRETIDRVFEPFFTTKPTGTGLGLPIVYSIVRSMDGDITLDSSEKGTVARVRVRSAEVPTPD